MTATLDTPTELIAPPEDQPRDIRGRTLDERASLFGSLAGSLALVWLVYERLFDFSGVLGFIVCWWLGYLVVYAAVSLMSNSRPAVVDRLATAVVTSGAALVGIALTSTVVFIAVKGWPAVHHWNFYTDDMAGVRPDAPLTQGGIRHAYVGSAIEVGLATVVSLPLGIGTAVYLAEVRGRLSQIVRTVVEAMTALPDILAGLFVYTVLIIALHWQRTGLTVAIALSVTMIPIIARAAEVVLRVVPGGLREASVALGASQWQTVRRVVLPTARAGLATALILGVARVAGETAPLLIVSADTTFFNANPVQDPMTSLPLYIVTAVRSGQPIFIARGYGAALILLVLVLALFCTTRFLARDKVGRR